MTYEQKAIEMMNDLGQQNNNWFNDFLKYMTKPRLEKINIVPNPKGTVSGSGKRHARQANPI